MNIGNLMIFLAFAATLVSAWNYFSAIKQASQPTAKGKQKAKATQNKIKFARFGFYAMTTLIVIASLYFLQLILTHQFQYSYIYRYSSRDLSLGLLISSFWAGQEGSFLLWALLIAIMGAIFIKTTKQFEKHGMIIVNLVQAFFLLILMKASPFAAEAHTPPDGAGLNPLLQNIWMIIHPPILFIGYAAATFPFALAFAALAQREYKQFAGRALPWVLFASITLGAGIIIGAYWAYQVLGWGGYWGWDPVENSSLIPWLTILALFHGLLVQKRKGALQKTNLFLAIISMVLVLYATFLTRSGVLADFSVHSFQDLGINFYLILFMAAVLGTGLGMFGRRYRDLAGNPISFTGLNKENIVLGSIIVFAVSAFLIFIGTSSPIITGFLGNASQPGVDYYNRVHLPIAIAIGLLLGVAPFLRWRENGTASLLKDVAPPLLFAGLVSTLAVMWGMSNPLYILFAAAAAFAFASNLIVAIRLLPKGLNNLAAPLAHVGVGLLLVGIIISGVFSRSQKVILSENIPDQVFDYRLTYKGMTPVPNGKDIFNIEVSEGTSSYDTRGRFYYSEYNRGMMAEPAVKSKAVYDLYISPLERRSASEQSGNGHYTMTVRKGETKQYGDYKVYFKNFEMGGDHGEAGAMRVGAQLEISNGSENYTIVPAVIYAQSGNRSEPASFAVKHGGMEAEASVALTGIDADSKAIELHFDGLETGMQQAASVSEQIIVEVSRKPFMNVLWVGTILLTLGTIVAMKRRMSAEA